MLFYLLIIFLFIEFLFFYLLNFFSFYTHIIFHIILFISYYCNYIRYYDNNIITLEDISEIV